MTKNLFIMKNNILKSEVDKRDFQVEPTFTNSDDRYNTLSSEAHLVSIDECTIKEKHSVPFFKLFRFASRIDRVLLVTSCSVAVIGGLIIPMILGCFSSVFQNFVDLGLERWAPFNCEQMEFFQGILDSGGDLRFALRLFGINDTKIISRQMVSLLRVLNIPPGKEDSTVEIPLYADNLAYPQDVLDSIRDELMSRVAKTCFKMLILALMQLVLLYLTVSFANLSAAKQGFRIRSSFLRSILRQEIAWFDKNHSENFAVNITNSLDVIQEGLGERLTLTIHFAATGIFCIVGAFVSGWRLSLVVTSLMPFVCLAAALASKYQTVFIRKEMAGYSKAGGIAEEVLSGIRTVMAYNGEKKELDRYVTNLRQTKDRGVKGSVILGVGYSIIWFLTYGSFSLALWYGSRLVIGSRCDVDEFTSTEMLTVLLLLLNCAICMSQTSLNFEAFTAARGAATKIFEIIDREPIIDSSSNAGVMLQTVYGQLAFRNVVFQYPMRPDVSVLRGVSFEVNPGDTVALVGCSGSGKSTVVHLLQRFYDPSIGQVLLDNTDIRNLNLGWYRSLIGIVGQEPSLFETTIAENIRYGNMEASDGALVQAAIAANAHDFIMKLPNQYNTLVGEKGTQLSGGQKQRIAIARALVRNPKFLLLDEATSALDSVSESLVQAALETARKGRTTIIIAHRLSTIRNADKIIVLKKGIVEEIGSHAELMAKESHYYKFVCSQAELTKEVENKHMEIMNIDDVIIKNNINNNLDETAEYKKHRRHSSLLDTIMRILPIEELTEKKKRSYKNFHQQIRLLRLCLPEWYLLLFGILASVVMGMSFPVFAVIFGDCINVLTASKSTAYPKINEYVHQMLFIGSGHAVAAFLQSVLYSVAGERQTLRVRKKVFRSLLAQDITWFDDPKNATGALCARLSIDASKVRIATVDRISTFTNALATLVTCFYVVFSWSTDLGLIFLAFMPLIFISTYLSTSIFGSHHFQEKLSEEGASKTAVEAISCIRTVTSLHRQETFTKKFLFSLKKPYRSVSRTAHFKAISFAFSQSTMCFAIIACIYRGSYIVTTGKLIFKGLFTVSQAIIVGILVFGQALTYAPEYQKAKQSADRIFDLLDRKPKKKETYNSITGALQSLDTEKYTGGKSVQFSNVHFSYPMRSEIKVLRGLDLTVPANQTVALVGMSGCGKSTCIHLLERFYECKKGEVLVENINIKDYSIPHLRSIIGHVGQEPVLLGYSVAENIAYGDNSRRVPYEEIVNAAKTANIHNFICSLPQGYDTVLGNRDSHLSGGEKQRVAIARALVRNPKILLLDEATSALDSQNEKIVQEALDKARQGRTCIVIAHRLSTVQNADMIAVIQDGKVVERGTHYELLTKRALYYKMFRMQNDSRKF